METNQRLGLITGKPLKSDEQLEKELTAPIAKEALKAHPTKTYLTSIKAIYVTERLNKVFGIGGWSVKTSEIERGDKGMVVVKVILEMPDYGFYYESYGGNDNGGDTSKNFDLGDAYKGATTDGITKIGSYLGIAIDVFKGLVSTPTTTNANTADLPWLNEKDTSNWNDALILMKSGGVANVRTKFRVSKEVDARLTTVFNNPTNVPEPSVADKAKQMGKQVDAVSEQDLIDYKEKIDKIATKASLTGFYNSLPDDVQANPTIQQYLKDRREAIKTTG